MKFDNRISLPMEYTTSSLDIVCTQCECESFASFGTNCLELHSILDNLGSKWFYTIFSSIVFMDTYLWHNPIEKNREISIIKNIEWENIEIFFFTSDIEWFDYSFESFRFFTPCFECYSEELHTKSIWKFRILQ